MLRLLLLALLAASAAPPPALTLVIEGITPVGGQLLIVVYDDQDAFPSTPDAAVYKNRIPAVAPTTTLTIDGLVPGTYAAVVVHDINSNNELDLRWGIPIPKEPIGASRDAKGFMGPPKFRDAAFELPNTGATQTIHLQRL